MFLHKCGDGAETIWAYLFRYVGWLTLNLDDNVPNRYEFEIPMPKEKVNTTIRVTPCAWVRPGHRVWPI